MGSTFSSLLRQGASFSTATIGRIFRNDGSARVALFGLFSERVRRIETHMNVSISRHALPGCLCAHGHLTSFIDDELGMSSLTFYRLGRRFVQRFRRCIMVRGNLNIRAIHRCLTVLGGVYHVTFGRKRSSEFCFRRCGLPGRGRAPPETLDGRSFRGVQSVRLAKYHPRRSVIESVFLFTYCTKASCISIMTVAPSGLSESSGNTL